MVGDWHTQVCRRPHIVVQKSSVLLLELLSRREQRLKFRLVKGADFPVTLVFLFHQALQGFRLFRHRLQAFPEMLPERLLRRPTAIVRVFGFDPAPETFDGVEIRATGGQEFQT